MLRHALTGSIFAIGSTRSTIKTLYCRIGDIVPAKRSVQLSESWRDNRTDLLRPESRTRHRPIVATIGQTFWRHATDRAAIALSHRIMGQTFS
jgi:hypothetical protein